MIVKYEYTDEVIQALLQIKGVSHASTEFSEESEAAFVLYVLPSFDDFRAKVDQSLVDLMIAPAFHVGDSIAPEKVFKSVYELSDFGFPSVRSGEAPEGVVYRVERKGKVDFLAKWVRSDFVPGKYCINVDEKDLIWNNEHELDFYTN